MRPSPLSLITPLIALQLPSDCHLITQIISPDCAQVSVTFALSSSGLIDISKAEMAIEMMESYEDFEMVRP